MLHSSVSTAVNLSGCVGDGRSLPFGLGPLKRSSPRAVDNGGRLQRGDRHGQEIRERILLTASERFGVKGFEGTSMRELAQQLDIPLAAIFYHFVSKENLWLVAIDNALFAYAKGANAKIEAAEPLGVGAMLRAWIGEFVATSARQSVIRRLFITDSNGGIGQDIIGPFAAWHFASMVELIRCGQAEGSVREHDPAQLYYFVISAGCTPFVRAAEYRGVTRRNAFSEADVLHSIASIYDVVFTKE